jgi:hypothetical protein
MKMARRVSKARKIRAYMLKHPNHTPRKVAEALGVDVQCVYQTRYNVSKAIKEMESKIKTVAVVTSNTSIKPPTANTITMIEPKADPVNHPPHYKAGGIETIDFIEAKKLNYNLGNVVKYITRADLKGNRKQDLAKALWYLQRELSGL